MKMERAARRTTFVGGYVSFSLNNMYHTLANVLTNRMHEHGSLLFVPRGLNLTLTFDPCSR